MGESFDASGGAKVHFDEALLLQPGSNLIVLTGSWAQLGRIEPAPRMT